MTTCFASRILGLWMLAACLLGGSLGCARLPSYRGGTTTPPANHGSVGQAHRPVAENPVAESPSRPAHAAAPEPDAAQEVIRGQGGFTLPAGFDVAADGGRHNRGPLPVSGTASETVAQNPLPPPPGNASPPAASAPYRANQPPAGTLPPPASSRADPPSIYNGAPVPTSPPISVMPEFNDPTGEPGLRGVPTTPYVPRTNIADVYIQGTPGRTGRIMFGGAVNSDAGLTGQITVDERNFDITRWPTSFRDLFSGTAFRGKGQTFRLEAVPGEQFQRYSVQFADPNLLGYLPISTNVSGFLNDRRYQDWDETRIGGRVAFGYRLTPDLSLSAGFKGQSVEFKNLRITGIPELDQYVGQHDLFAGEFRLSHDTRNTPFGASEGHFLQWTFEQTFGDFVYPKAELDFRRYFLVRQRADGSGKHTLTMSTQFGVTGNDTPVFENFFAGGYSTLRGFEFRGASPTISGMQTGGRLSWLNSVEYMFPITADDAFRAVTFVDFGTVERDFDMNSDNFRVAPGVGLRLAIPALGPSPLAFDFAFPVADAAGDERQVFSFYMSAAR